MTGNRVSDNLPSSLREFFDSYWGMLEKRGWQAVILHSWVDLPEVIDSDVDYAVKSPSHRELLESLSEFSRSKGWRLIQVIEHEPGAFFCVCMQSQPPFEYLQLDVTWEYRRIGHHLVDADILFGGCRRIPGKAFTVPSPGAEFTYLLAKAAAKGKGFGQMQDRLLELLEEDPGGCRRTACRAFGDVPSTSGSDPDQMAAWADWFAKAPFFQPIRAGRKFGIGEISLYLRRILHPTGARISINQEEFSKKATELAAALSPAFREVSVRGNIGMKHWPGLLARLIRTTLVIQANSGETMIPQDSEHFDSDNPISRAVEQLAARTERRIRSH